SDDVVVIDAQYGSVQVDGTAGQATVKSINAAGGLELTASAWGLNLTSGPSVIHQLVLTNNASLEAGPGVIVSLTGSTRLGSDLIGPGQFLANGATELGTARLRTQAGVTILDSGSLSTGAMNLFDSDTILLVQGVLQISNLGSAIQGVGARLVNEGALTINRPNTDTFLDPNYTQTGFLHVQSGTTLMQGLETSLEDGTIVVEAGAELEHRTPFGGAQSHRYAGLVSVSGLGLVDVYNDFLVGLPVTFDVGIGSPSSGTGGYRLQSTLTVSFNVSNTGRFRFNGGRLAQQNGAAFVNVEGAWAYTRNTGPAFIECYFTNWGNFEVGGAAVNVDGSFGRFDNRGLFRITSGNLLGTGNMGNQGDFRLEAANSTDLSFVNLAFTSFNGGTVTAQVGRLVFTDMPWQVGEGILHGGRWIATSSGEITFPETIIELGPFARLVGPLSSYPNVDLGRISLDAELETDDWDRKGDLTNDGGSTRVDAGGTGLRVTGTYHNVNGGVTEIEDDATLDAELVNNGSDSDSVLSELGGIVVLAKDTAANPAVVNTPQLNNHGRILPGGDGGPGQIRVTGNFTQLAGGELKIDWRGLTPGVDHDQLIVEGNATVGGMVDIFAIDGYIPTQGEQITILTTTGTLSGTFSGVNSTDGNLYSLVHGANGVVAVVDQVAGPVAADPVPSTSLLRLSPAVPNPANPSSEFTVSARPGSDLQMEVYSLRGQRLRSQHLRVDGSGRASFTFDGRDHTGSMLPSGVYLIRAVSEGEIQSRSVTLVK
ncbi:MAG: hypothetical protein HKO53_17055, partial [Gemmatimonadetes bacterium]|nr:hypothetical protein [Gemmatimonadota bacterium]